MASGLPYQVALDDSLVLSNPYGTVEISSALVTQQRYPSTSASLSQIQFQNIKLSGQSSLFDSKFLLEYNIEFQADLALGEMLPGLLFTQPASEPLSNCAITADTCTYPILETGANGAFKCNIANMNFRGLPLSHNVSALQVAINNANSQTYSLQQELALSDPLTEDMKNAYAGLCPVDNAHCAVIPDFYTLTMETAPAPFTITVDATYKGGMHQVNNQVWNGGRNHVKVVSVTKAAGATVYNVVYTIREPVLADPFTCGYRGPAICNTDSLVITYSIDISNSLQGMFVASKNMIDGSASGPSIAGVVAVNITNCALITQTYSVDHSVINIPAIAYYDYSSYQFNQTAVSSANTTGTTNTIGLNTVPKMYVSKIQELPNGLTAIPSQQIGAAVSTITVQYGSLGRFVFTREQLYEMFLRNSKVEKTYSEWLNDCVVMINPSLDLVNSASSFTGIANGGNCNWSVQYQYDLQPYTIAGLSVPSNLYINEMFIFAGNLAIGNGQAVYSTTTISAAQLVAAMDKPMVSSKVLRSSHGVKSVRAGSLFGSIGNVLRGAVSALPSVINTAQSVLQHPAVQSALGALGSGLTYSSRRVRR